VRATRLIKSVNLLAVVLPLLGFVAAVALLWGTGFDWAQFGIFIAAYLLTGIGITIGYHTLFTHRSFETHRLTAAIFGVLGSMAVEGPLLRWVACHRRHHQHADAPMTRTHRTCMGKVLAACSEACGTRTSAGSFILKRRACHVM
jgi:stearoyl-CoA desaturase (delta-9 desaturase)